LKVASRSPENCLADPKRTADSSLRTTGISSQMVVFSPNLFWDKSLATSWTCHILNLSGSNIAVPHVIAAVQAFHLLQNILRIFPGKYLPIQRRIFNRRLYRSELLKTCLALWLIVFDYSWGHSWWNHRQQILL